jgi:hypothetical protein
MGVVHFNAAFIPKACMVDAFGQVFRLVPRFSVAFPSRVWGTVTFAFL